MIKNREGILTGPLTTSEVLARIRRGEYEGDEQISTYPLSRWHKISQEPEFYDQLLDALSANTRPIDEDDLPQESDEFAKPLSGEGTKTHPEELPDPTLPPLEAAPGAQQYGEKDKARAKRKKRPEDIELVDTKGRRQKLLLRAARMPVALVIILLLAGGYLLLSPEEMREERIHLLAPQSQETRLSQSQIQQKSKRAVDDFSRDTFNDYLRAQNELVQIVEGAPRHGEAMALLCVVYFELWPFAYQDSKDFRALSRVVQLSSAADPTGAHSSTCKAVDLMLKGRYAEAKSIAETMLETYPAGAAQLPTIFYYIQAVLLESGGDLAAAVSYLSTAQRLWPQWVKPFAYQAHLYSRLEKYSEAEKLYRSVLKASPRHSVSKIELGIIEFKQFRNIQKAEELIHTGLADEAAVPKRVLSRGHFVLAEIHLERRDAAAALESARRAYSLDSTFTLAKNLVIQLGGAQAIKKTKIKSYQLIAEGDQFFREGDYNSAQAHFKAAYEADPKNAVAAMKAATSLWRLSLSTEAMDWLNKAIRSDPKLIEAYVLLADYQTQRYNFIAAAQVLNGAQRVAPQSYEVYRGFAMVELRRHNPKDAAGYAKQALALYEMDVDAQVIMAEAQMKMNDNRAAFTHASKAIEIDVNNRKAQIVYGRALAGLQGVESGASFFHQLVKNFPVVGEYRLALGQLMLEDQRYTQAEEVFRQLTRIETQSKDAFLYLGRSLQLQSRFEEALEAYLRAAILDPADAEPLFQAGLLYLEVNRAEEARVQFQRVLRINKLYPLAHYQLGRAALMRNDPQEALDEAKEEKRLNPSLADAYLLAAEAYTLMQQYTLCVGEYQRAVKLRPQNARIYLKMANCYRKSDQLEVAIAMLNQAAIQESGLAEIYRELGIIYEIKGDVAKALEAYRQYFVLNPSALDRGQIEQRILNLQRRGSR